MRRVAQPELRHATEHRGPCTDRRVVGRVGRVREMCEGLIEAVPGQVAFARGHGVPDGRCRTGQRRRDAPVIGTRGEVIDGEGPEQRLVGECGTVVQLRSSCHRQAVVDGRADHAVAEAEDAGAGVLEQPGGASTLEDAEQIGGGRGGVVQHVGEHPIVDLVPDDRRVRKDGRGVVAEGLDAPFHHVGDGRRRSRRIAAAGEMTEVLADEQRIAGSRGVDLCRRRSFLPCGARLVEGCKGDGCQRCDVADVDGADIEHEVAGAARLDACGRERVIACDLGVAHRGQHEQPGGAVTDQVANEFDGRPVGPLEIVEHEHHRVLAAQGRQRRRDGPQQPCPIRRWIRSRRWDDAGDRGRQLR